MHLLVFVAFERYCEVKGDFRRLVRTKSLKFKNRAIDVRQIYVACCNAASKFLVLRRLRLRNSEETQRLIRMTLNP